MRRGVGVRFGVRVGVRGGVSVGVATGVVLAALAGCAGAEEMGEEEEEGALCEIEAPLGPTAVRIPGAEVAEAERWSVSELWRAGGVEDDGAGLTLPTSARVGPGGTLAIPDFQSGDVWLLGGDGRWLDPVAGRGEGPGELANPLAAAWSPEGALLVLDAAGHKLERFDLDTGGSETLRLPVDLLGPVFASGEVGWFGLSGDGTAFVELPSRRVEEGTGTIAFARARPGSDGREEAWTSSYPDGLVPAYDRPSRPEWPRALLGVGRAGWAVAPRSDRYEVVVFGSGGAAVLHLCVTDAEEFRQTGEGPHPPDEEFVERIMALPPAGREAIFSRVEVDHDGRIWIEREIPRAGSSFDRLYGVAGAHLDVFSPAGEMLARVRLPEGFRFQDAQGDTVWAFEIGDFQEVQVVAGRVVRGGGG